MKRPNTSETEKKHTMIPMPADLQRRLDALEFMSHGVEKQQTVSREVIWFALEKCVSTTISALMRQPHSRFTNPPYWVKSAKPDSKQYTANGRLIDKEEALYPTNSILLSKIQQSFEEGCFDICIVYDTEEVMDWPFEIRLVYKDVPEEKFSLKAAISNVVLGKNTYDNDVNIYPGYSVVIYIQIPHLVRTYPDYFIHESQGNTSRMNAKASTQKKHLQNELRKQIIEAYYQLQFNKPGQFFYTGSEKRTRRHYVSYSQEVNIRTGRKHGRKK